MAKAYHPVGTRGWHPNQPQYEHQRNVKPAVSEHVTRAATLLVLEVMPGHCPLYRIEQIYHEVTTAMGRTGDKALIAELKRELRHRGKIEHEIEAIEDVLIKHYRNWTCS